MHHKFCVFDDQYVFTGSWNPTKRGTNFNDNYILLMSSPEIAGRFEDMYLHLLNRTFTVEPLTIKNRNSSVELYTCPLHDCQGKVLEELSKAKETVRILAFTFTDQEIAEELLHLSRKGLRIEVIFEKTRITRYSAIHVFKDSSIEVFHDGNPYTMHQKMILIDDEKVFLGSYNPTKSATLKNDENLLLIQHSDIVAKALLEYFRIRVEANRLEVYK